MAATQQFQALADSGAEAFVRTATISLAPPTEDKPYLNFFAKTPGEIVRLFLPYLALSLLMALTLVGMFVGDAMSLGGVGRARRRSRDFTVSASCSWSWDFSTS